jgi:HK97 family phage major capsid protein
LILERITLMSEYLKRQTELRATAWEEAKHLLDAAAAESRDLTAEENVIYDRISEDMDNRARVIEQITKDEERAQRLDVAAASVRTDEVAPADDDDAEAIRSLARGEIRSLEFEKRDVLKTNTGAPVATSFYDQIILKARLVGPMLTTSTVLTTAGGENLQIPRVNTYSAATIATEAAAIGESDPAFSAFITMSAFKFSYLVQVSREMIEDSGVDILGFLADQVGQGIGFNVNAALTTGTATTQPNGIVTASTLGVTGGTGTSGAFTADNLIDLAYSVDGAARMLPGAGYMMNGKSIGAVRKLKDTAGNYVFAPRLNENTPDTLLGFPLYENPAMADAGTAAKSVIFGHLPSYYVRQVGGIRVDSSSDFAFSTDLVTLRTILRVDGNLPQVSHVNHFIGGAS